MISFTQELLGGFLGALVANIGMKLVVDNIADPIDENIVDPLVKHAHRLVSDQSLWDFIDVKMISQEFTLQKAAGSAIIRFAEKQPDSVKTIMMGLILQWFNQNIQNEKAQGK